MKVSGAEHGSQLQLSSFLRLGWTRGGSPGIFGVLNVGLCAFTRNEPAARGPKMGSLSGELRN
jgi:hypothetical protein